MKFIVMAILFSPTCNVDTFRLHNLWIFVQWIYKCLCLCFGLSILKETFTILTKGCGTLGDYDNKKMKKTQNKLVFSGNLLLFHNCYLCTRDLWLVMLIKFNKNWLVYSYQCNQFALKKNKIHYLSIDLSRRSPGCSIFKTFGKYKIIFAKTM